MQDLKKASLRSLSLTAVLLLSGVMIMVSVALAIVYQNMREAQQEWQRYDTVAQRKFELYNQLRNEIGYGGLIHDFKNFLLRKDVAYKEDVFHAAERVRGILSEYRVLAISRAEERALTVILDMVNTNEGNMAIAESLFETGIPLEAIDAQVRFDERPAVAAMDVLASHGLREREQGRKQVFTVLDRALSHSVYLGISVIVLFGLTIVIFFFALRMLMAHLQSTADTLKALAAGEADTPIQFVEYRNEVGDLARAAVVFRDALHTVTRQVEELEQLNSEIQARGAKLEAVVETAVEGIIIMNEKGIVQTFNPAASAVFGYARSEVQGQNVSLLMPEPVRSAHDGYLERYLETGKTTAIGTLREVTGQRKNGETFPMDLAVAEIRSSGVHLYVGMLRDISSRKAVEWKLRDNAEEMAAKNEELLTALDQLQATMDKAVHAEKLAALGSLVSGVAHEINTPLGVAITSASLISSLLESIDEQIKVGKNLSRQAILTELSRANEALTLLRNNLGRSANLVHSFRQIAVDQSSDVARTLDVGAYLHQLADSLRSQIQSDRVTLHLECPKQLKVCTYPGVLAQVATQLTMNSLAHAFGEGRKGKILIRADADRAGGLVFEYQDNGRGIPEEDRSRIFEPFYTTSRGRGRAGLGLHVVHNQVTAVLGGTIECEPVAGGGVRFRITAPPAVEVEPA